MKPFGKVEEVKKFGKIMVIAMGFGLLAVALSSIPTRPAAASGSAPVMVTNTPLPVSVANTSVPVSGTVNVGNLPAVQAVNGTVRVGNFPAVQNVSFNGTAQPVSFSNTSATPFFVDVDNPARTAFDVAGSCLFSGTPLCADSALFSVPAGKIAVIESASGNCSTDLGVNLALADFHFTGSSSSSFSSFTLGRAVPNGSIVETSFAQNVRRYAFGGTTGTGIGMEALATGSNTGSCLLSVSGYLVTP